MHGLAHLHESAQYEIIERMAEPQLAFEAPELVYFPGAIVEAYGARVVDSGELYEFEKSVNSWTEAATELEQTDDDVQQRLREPMHEDDGHEGAFARRLERRGKARGLRLEVSRNADVITGGLVEVVFNYSATASLHANAMRIGGVDLELIARRGRRDERRRGSGAYLRVPVEVVNDRTGHLRFLYFGDRETAGDDFGASRTAQDTRPTHKGRLPRVHELASFIAALTDGSPFTYDDQKFDDRSKVLAVV